MNTVNVFVMVAVAGLAALGIYRFLTSDLWQTRGKMLRNPYTLETN